MLEHLGPGYSAFLGSPDVYLTAEQALELDWSMRSVSSRSLPAIRFSKSEGLGS